jgi:hypothetical protein
MIKAILPATLLSLMLIPAAWAWPISPTTQIDQPTSNLVQVGYKGHHGYKHYNHHYAYKNYGRYHYGNRYWGHRYYARPYNWQTIGCIAVGPIWYCP